MSLQEIYGLLLALLFAAAAGAVGSFAVMRRLILASDVMSHLALPGLGLAFLLGFNPLLGGAGSLFLGVLLVWHLQEQTGLATDLMIGVVFVGAIAIAALVTPSQDLEEALFGSFEAVSSFGFIAGMIAILLIFLFLFQFKEQLILSVLSPELAAATGVKLSRLNLLFLLSFCLTLIVGLRFMGGLLASSLLILPAAAARRLTSSVKYFVATSSIMSVACLGIGFLFTRLLFPGWRLGPTTIMLGALLFGLSLLRPPR
jgi:zinc transport system permease protein